MSQELLTSLFLIALSVFTACLLYAFSILKDISNSLKYIIQDRKVTPNLGVRSVEVRSVNEEQELEESEDELASFEDYTTKLKEKEDQYDSENVMESLKRELKSANDKMVKEKNNLESKTTDSIEDKVNIDFTNDVAMPSVKSEPD